MNWNSLEVVEVIAEKHKWKKFWWKKECLFTWVVLLVSVVVEIVVEVVEVGTVNITLFVVASKYKFVDF